MQGKHLFEYSIIRYVPKVERGEAINLGIIMFCKELGYLKLKYKLDKVRLRAFHCDADIDNLEMHLRSFELVSIGDETAFGIASLNKLSASDGLLPKEVPFCKLLRSIRASVMIRMKCSLICSRS